MDLLFSLVAIGAAVIGLAVAIWSFIDTRNKYYKDYLKRKIND